MLIIKKSEPQIKQTFFIFVLVSTKTKFTTKLLLRFPQKYLLFESAVATQLEKKQTGAYAGNRGFLVKIYLSN